MIPITIDEAVKNQCPDLSLLCVQARVVFTKEHPALWEEIDQVCDNLQTTLQRETLA